jgi:hypothetical protein
MRLTATDTPACLVSDEMDWDNGRTIVWRKQKVLVANGKITSADLQPPDPLTPCGLTSINVQCDDGVADITWTFRAEFNNAESVNGNYGAPTGQNATTIYELQGSTSQEPITSHPKYEDLLEKYAITERHGEPVWMEKDPDGKSQRTALSKDGTVVSNISPLYGVRDYLAAQGVYRLTKYYTTRGAIPSDLVSNVGKIDEPEGLANNGTAGRWLRVGASMRQMGDAFQVTISWMASQSDKNLWKSEIYGNASQGNQGNGNQGNQGNGNQGNRGNQGQRRSLGNLTLGEQLRLGQT